MRKNTIDFTMGADPELCLMERGDSVISAEDCIEDCDREEKFGIDGNGVTFEVRPLPSRDPLKIVSNIHTIFINKISQKRKLLNYNWHAGSYQGSYGLGGHIHFGTHHKIVPSTAVNILDNYLASVLILIEEKGQAISRRQSAGYGMLGDYRRQTHGFEYRTPSSWLVSPYITSATLCLAKIIMFETLNNPKFSPKVYINSNDIYYVNPVIRTKFPEIWREITQMALYQKYKPYVDLIYFLINNNLTWFPTSSMKESWGLFDARVPNSKKIKLDFIWARYKQESNQS